MDAVKFIEERKRLCAMHPGCPKCPAFRYNNSCMFNSNNGGTPVEQVEFLEEWSAAHPRKTRQSVFLEQWPNAKIRKDGILDIYPCVVCTTKRKDNNCESVAFSCVNCRREFWMQEVE